MSKSSVKKKGPKGPSPEEMERNIKVHDRERILMEYLSPIESSVMTFQNVLVWENPKHSAVLFVVVHILFWLATTVRIYYVIGITGTIVVAVDMWKNHIWPEIRVPQSPDADQDDWIPVHPRLISVPEICQWIAEWWVSLADIIHAGATMRHRSHPKFFLYAMITLTCTGVLGCYIPGILIAYITVLFGLLWPCILYHDGLHHIQALIQPMIRNIEEKLNIKRKRKGTCKGKRKHGAAPTLHDESGSDSDDLEDFVPEHKDPEITMTLAQAESESEEDEEGLTHGLLTPPHIPSQNPSREHSDAEDCMSASMDELGSLVHDLTSIPSHDEVHDDIDPLATGLNSIPSHDDIDHIADTKTDLEPFEESLLSDQVDEAMAEENDLEDSKSEADQQAIEFVSSHFSQFSDEDDSDSNQPKVDQEEEIIKELAESISDFPDVEEEPIESSSTILASGLQLLTSQGHALVSQGQTLVSAIGTTNVSQLMTNTLAGLSTLRDAVVSSVLPPGEGDSSLTDSIDSKQLEAEFEFLDEDDLLQENLDEAGLPIAD